MSKTGAFFLGVLVMFGIGTAVTLINQSKYYKDKKIWQQRMDERDKEEKRLKAESDALRKKAAENLAEANLWHGKADEFEGKWKQALGRAEYWHGQAQTITPTEVVRDTIQYLVVTDTDVRLLRSGNVLFTLTAARKNLDQLYQFNLVTGPALKEALGQIDAQKNEIKSLRLSITDWEGAGKKWDEERIKLIEDKDDYASQLRRCEASKKWKFGFNLATAKNVGIPVVTFILGVVVGK